MLSRFFYNFLTVYFANQFLPGIEVIDLTKLPHIGADIYFALVLGTIYFLLPSIISAIVHRVSVGRTLITSLILSLSAYAIVKFAPIGIEVLSVEGYLYASAFVTIGTFFSNYSEIKRYVTHKEFEKTEM